MTNTSGTRGGYTFVPSRHTSRLNEQHRRVLGVMKDGNWHTLSAISMQTGDPEASVSARIRDFRKKKFGGMTVERRYVAHGLHEYRLIVSV